MEQLNLIEKTDTEKLAILRKALEKFGRHGFYCCWVRDRGIYDRSLGCTCGLDDALKESE